MRFDHIFALSSVSPSPDGGVAFGLVDGTDEAAATADEICSHCRAEDSSNVLIASGCEDWVVAADAAADVALTDGVCAGAVVWPAWLAGVLDGVICCAGWCELATLSSLLYVAGLAASRIATSGSAFGKTTGLRMLPPRGPSGGGPPIDTRGPRGGGGVPRCSRPRPGDLDLELRGASRRASRSRLAERPRMRDASDGISRSRLMKRRGGDRRRPGLGERGRCPGWKLRMGERWRPMIRRYSSSVR